MLAGAASGLTGCGVDSFLDPSRTGRFEAYPTSINVLDRIDAIEHESGYFTRATQVAPEDLIPSELAYYLYPGDTVTVAIFELYQPAVWSTTTRRVDAGGFYRVPEVGDVRAAGLTPQQFQTEVIKQLQERVFTRGTRPQVDVIVESAGGLRYTVYGFVQNPGVFNLQNPDLRLLDALAIAGGVPVTTEHVYVIRTVPLTEEQRPTFAPSRGGTGPESAPSGKPPVDVNELINQLPNQPGQPTTKPDVHPGMLQDAPVPPTTQRDKPPIDIDALEPTKVQAKPPPVDVDETRPPRPPDDVSGDTFIYVPERGEWVRVRGEGDNRQGVAGSQPDVHAMVRERIIEIDYKKLARGDSSQNIVIRPDDRIYIDGPEQGLVYIDGEVNRIGVYQMPTSGILTLSRAITAAGGLGPVAIPEKVDLTRRVGPNREATLRVNLAAIRQRTEPDIVMRPDDHIIIGTTFWATPLAVVRNGFRMTYGFGFLFDKNFAEEVFGVTVSR
jgi:polysaccharide export outer membrane protein